MNILADKTMGFAVKIIGVFELLKKRGDFELARQVMRSGTSIGTNIEEALGGQSKKDFIAKLFISYKELRETHFWLKILTATGKMAKLDFEKLETDLVEIRKILVSSIKTAKRNLEKEK